MKPTRPDAGGARQREPDDAAARCVALRVGRGMPARAKRAAIRAALSTTRYASIHPGNAGPTGSPAGSLGPAYGLLSQNRPVAPPSVDQTTQRRRCLQTQWICWKQGGLLSRGHSSCPDAAACRGWASRQGPATIMRAVARFPPFVAGVQSSNGGRGHISCGEVPCGGGPGPLGIAPA